MNLNQVKQPAQYTGHELNMCVKDPASVGVRFAFCFPDTYAIGMSSLGLKIIYDVLNRREDCYCERAFAPWADREAQLRTSGEKLCTLETNTPLCEFDVVGFTLQYELSFTNVLLMLDLGGIPLLSKDRTEKNPIIIAGGSCACNPEPLADYIDLFVIGDGEEVINELIEHIKNGKTKNEILTHAEQIPGIYAPHYHQNKPIKQRKIKDLNAAPFPESPIVPYTETVHDRMVLEIARGCGRGCRFCQAGMLYRPVRERSPETLLRQAKNLYKNTGYDEIGFCSLSAGDHSQIQTLITQLNDEFTPKHVSISLPSMRVDALPGSYLEQLASVRRAGLTFAPEAGTQRLRDVINKNITEDDLFNSLKEAYRAGWNQIKLYFMLGLPTETQEDLDGIAMLAKKAAELYFQVPHASPKKAPAVSVSVSTFVPKPHTPFQWCGQDAYGTILEKQAYLRGIMRRVRNVTLSTHSASVSVLESAFARGNRRLGAVLLAAYAKGCRFDGWTECFRYDYWKQAFIENGLSIEECAEKTFEQNDNLPWDMIRAGVTKAYLQRECQAALSQKTTPACYEKCGRCGVCV